jgi:hypothetical protein
LFFLLALISCPAENPSNGSNPGDEETIKTGSVTFFNESSYNVTVHRDAFSGPVLLTLSAGQSKKVAVRISDNYGIGSTFCVEYSYRVVDGTDMASGEVWANGIDPNVQINFVVEENQSYTKQIPQPTNLEFPMAFIKILNTSATQFELAHLGTSYKQTGNGALSVPSGKTGVYKIESTAAGKAYNDFEVVSVFNRYAIPAFSAQNSYIYNFTFNGTNVTAGSAQKIVF